MLKDISLNKVNEHRQKIHDLESLPSFKLRRDKFHAHFDKEYFLNRHELGKKAPFKWRDLDRIIEIMKEILNAYSVAFDGHSYTLEALNGKDIKNLLDKLHNERKKNTS